jgi:serine/threonine protein kinase
MYFNTIKDEIIKENIVGTGSYGIITIFEEENKYFIKKKERKKNCKSLEREVKIFNHLKKLKDYNESNIVKYIKSGFSYDNFNYIILEYNSNLNLRQYLLKNYNEKFKPGDFLKTYNFFCTMIKTLKFLKNNNIIHFDIKPENIIIDNNDNYSLTKFKLCDFGSAIFSDEEIFNLPPLRYRAPELIDLSKFSFEIDLWSLGCILWEILILDDLLFDFNEQDKVYQSQIKLCSNDNLIVLIEKRLKNIEIDEHDNMFLQYNKLCDLKIIFKKLLSFKYEDRSELYNFVPIYNDNQVRRRKSSPSY